MTKHDFQEIAGLVLVVDSTDRDRIEDAKDFLNAVIDEIQGSVPDNVAVLVFGNKHEVPGAMSASEISNKLDLTSLRQKNWQRNW
jgi:ADP-ribosylation factor protein 1/Arf/Sar family protein